MDFLKIFAKSAVNCFVALMVLGIVFIWIVPLLFGAKPTTVLSGSMEPTLSAGDVIWVDTTTTRAKIGEIVVFHPEAYNNDLTTHRVIAKTLGTQETYTTQGDANNTADEPIVEEQIVGIVKSPLSYFPFLSKIGIDEGAMMSFPYAGHLQKYLVPAGAILISMSILWWLIGRIKTSLNRRKPKGESSENEKEVE